MFPTKDNFGRAKYKTKPKPNARVVRPNAKPGFDLYTDKNIPYVIDIVKLNKKTPMIDIAI